MRNERAVLSKFEELALAIWRQRRRQRAFRAAGITQAVCAQMDPIKPVAKVGAEPEGQANSRIRITLTSKTVAPLEKGALLASVLTAPPWRPQRWAGVHRSSSEELHCIMSCRM